MPSTRKLDPSTSHQAEKSVSGMAESYRIITDLFRTYGPMNDETLLKVWRSTGKKPASDSGIRSRRSELAAMGMIVDSGDRIKMASNRMSIVWKLS